MEPARRVARAGRAGRRRCGWTPSPSRARPGRQVRGRRRAVPRRAAGRRRGRVGPRRARGAPPAARPQALEALAAQAETRGRPAPRRRAEQAPGRAGPARRGRARRPHHAARRGGRHRRTPWCASSATATRCGASWGSPRRRRPSRSPTALRAAPSRGPGRGPGPPRAAGGAEPSWVPGRRFPLPPRLRLRQAAPFVGRAGELAALRRAWRDTCDGLGPLLVVVGGEAGIGKSRLARELAMRVRGAPAVVLQGTAQEDAIASLQPIVEAVGHLIRVTAPDALSRILGARTAISRRLIPGPSRRAGRRVRRRRRAALPHGRRRRRAARGRVRRRAGPARSSTTCTGPTRPRRACSGTCWSPVPARGSWWWRHAGRTPSRPAGTSPRRSSGWTGRTCCAGSVSPASTTPTPPRLPGAWSGASCPPSCSRSSSGRPVATRSSCRSCCATSTRPGPPACSPCCGPRCPPPPAR